MFFTLRENTHMEIKDGFTQKAVGVILLYLAK